MARRRRMHRDTRRFLIGLGAVAACVCLTFWGGRKLFKSSGTELAGTTDQPAKMLAEPGLRPIVPATGDAAKPAGAEPAAAESAKAAPAPAAETADNSKLPALKPVKPAASDGTPVPPTTQPTAFAKLPPDEAAKEMAAGFSARDKHDLVAARTHLNKALHGGLPAADVRKVREALADLAEQTIFSERKVLSGDPLVERYTVKIGDSLAKIARRNQISEDFLAGLNKITNKNIVRLGQSLKVVRGPFNTAVVKHDHELHVYLQDVYVRSFKVALGADGSTPTGAWKVVNHLENPGWTDPQGRRWHPNDPKNPIGEFWIGLEGIDGDAVGRSGFGIHGTIEPETIGQDVSLGCIRLGADDIAFLYKLLMPGDSVVTVQE